MANLENNTQNSNKNNEIVRDFSNVEEAKKDDRSICCYARVSTQGQEKGLESQVRALRAYCKQNGIDNYLLFTDEGISGTKSSRPALDKMMNAVREGKISKVIVYSFSRYARSVTHLLSALQEFKELNTDFISVSERIDTNTPLGQAMFTVLSAISHYAKFGIMRSEPKFLVENQTFRPQFTPHNI